MRGRPHTRPIRTALLAALALGCACAAAAAAPQAVPAAAAMRALHGAAAAGGPAVKPAPPYSARLLSCRRSLRIGARAAAVAAAMRPIAGGKRLALRIELAQRPLAGGRWTLRSDVPGLGLWTSPSDPAIGSRPRDVFKYHQAVGRLVVGFAYRFRVAFRWLDAGGGVVREASAATRPCREPDLRPDLVLPRVRTAPAPRNPANVRYTVAVRNDGRSTARGVVVTAALPNDPSAAGRTRTIARLRPHQTAAVTFVGPGCRAGAPPPTFTVDSANAVDEANEGNNQLLAACPST